MNEMRLKTHFGANSLKTQCIKRTLMLYGELHEMVDSQNAQLHMSKEKAIEGKKEESKSVWM